ncbi:hypothetical protein B9Z19DRAFT_1164615, partial [Tuber borchii]
MLRDYFKFEVQFVPNVTDVDDKVGSFFPSDFRSRGKYMEWLRTEPSNLLDLWSMLYIKSTLP